CRTLSDLHCAKMTVVAGAIYPRISSYSLAVLLPSIGVSIRRLHDTGRSGFWLLIAFVPIIGAVVLIVFDILESQPGDNEYGPYPHPATP
ncbi:MAG: DUF805 domain-containing protein, partial [Nevskiales bacterium]